jgi:adenosylcobyric acid synthase
MEHLDIDDEDSLSDRLEQTQKGTGLDIAVIHLPHISNFTDFSAFERMDGVSLRYVQKPGMLGDPDLILLPGTKNTMDDMQWLRESGMEALILRQAEKKTPIIGICGGFQLLGGTMEDPYQVEHGGTMRGMGLLDTRTVFSKAKTRTQIQGVMEQGMGLWKDWEGKEVTGYEIHMGVTENLGGCREMVKLCDGRIDALSNEDGSVLGSYLHGIFDTDGFAEAMVRRLMAEKGMDYGSWTFDLAAHKEQEYDKLADLVRSSFDMKKIYEILEEGIGC